MNPPSRQMDSAPHEAGRLVVEITDVHVTQLNPFTHWRPSINAYRCDDCFIICVDLAGVDPQSIKVRAAQRHVSIRGNRPMVQPSCDEPQPVQMLALEIDHGPFERTLELAEDVDPEGLHYENRSGLLWIQLPLR